MNDKTPPSRSVSGDPPAVPGDQAAVLVGRTGIPVLLLAGLVGVPTLTAGTGGNPLRYISTTALYEDDLRTEVHAPGGPHPEQLVRCALPGASTTSSAYLATPVEMALGVEARHNGLIARSAVWGGWTLLQLTSDQSGRGRLPALRMIGADSLSAGRPGRPYRPGLLSKNTLIS
ncbi:hypothetical protein [Streptomyces sp. CBMA123]|uniref:hypothetical protein n=1 Tax=Streptomyces sp. CBMA123 TaxID=1896313 RepID=UPI001661FC36|nr:hypothetical protein [Streptomyces sp. CBMA123]MBD0692469.1 hypothetical protein [Streptomyces sp. CBMA123]